MGQIITDLLCTYQDNEDVIHCWVEGVVPMIAEEEIKAQEKVIEVSCVGNILYYTFMNKFFSLVFFRNVLHL